MNYASGSTNCALSTRAQTSGSRPRHSEGLKKNARTFVSLRPDLKEWQAFQEMFLTARPTFLRMAYSILRNREDVDDAIQDALLSAYLHLRAFEGRSALTTWFGRIVLNASLMIRRKRKPEFLRDSSASDDAPWMRDIRASGPDPEMSFAEKERLALVDALLGKMSPMLRQAFTMTYFEEMSTAEAGAVLGVSVGTFKSRLFRARQHLMNQAQRALVSPIHRVTRPAFFRGNNNFPAHPTKSAEIPTPRATLPELNHFSHAPGSGTPSAND